MEVNGKPLEIIETINYGQGGSPPAPRKWELRKDGIKVGVIFDRDVAKALGAKV